MEKTFLEEKIKEMSVEQTKEEYRKFIEFIYKNKFGKKLEIRIGDEKIPLCNFGSNFALFNDDITKNKRSVHSNLEEVYKKVLEENIKKNTNDMLNKLDSISYLFGDQQ